MLLLCNLFWLLRYINSKSDHYNNYDGLIFDVEFGGKNKLFTNEQGKLR